MADKVKSVAVEEAEKVKNLTRDAARSGAYLYPLRVSLDFFDDRGVKRHGADSEHLLGHLILYIPSIPMVDMPE